MNPSKAARTRRRRFLTTFEDAKRHVFGVIRAVTMTNASFEEGARKARTLLFSHRNIFEGALFRCPHYEFEDITCQIDSVDVLAPRPTKWFKYGSRIANRLAQDTTVALNPGIEKVKLKSNYDLFFAVCGFPKDLLHVNE